MSPAACGAFYQEIKVSAKLLSFPDRFKKAEDRHPEVVEADIRPRPAPAEPPAAAQADPRVVVPMSVFENMVAALQFYANQGFDHGRRAQAAMAVPSPNPPGAAA
jgi:hypothetical protein